MIHIAHTGIETIEEVISSVKHGIAKRTGFELTEAVCPINEINIRVGFKRAAYIDQIYGRMYVVIITQTKTHLFDLFIDLAEKFFKLKKMAHPGINAVLEGSHPPVSSLERHVYDASGKERPGQNYISKNIDLITFLSRLCDFERSFLEDGFMELSLLSRSVLSELRFSSHKSILFFSSSRRLTNMICVFLREKGIAELQEINTVEEEKHIHLAPVTLIDKFYQLVMQSGAMKMA